MTYLPVPPEVTQHVDLVSVRLPHEVLIGLLVQVAATTVGTGSAGTAASVWEEIGYAAQAAEDDDRGQDECDAWADAAVQRARELLSLVVVDDTFELSWSVAQRFAARVLEVAHPLAGGRGLHVVLPPAAGDPAGSRPDSREAPPAPIEGLIPWDMPPFNRVLGEHERAELHSYIRDKYADEDPT